MDYDHCFIQKKDDNDSQKVVLFDTSDCSRRRVTFSLVMFMYSYTTIGNLAFYSLLKDVLHLDPAELNGYYTFINLLFLLKPLYGFVTDTCYIFGRHRQPYIMLGGVTASLLWVLMAFFAENALFATIMMFMINGTFALINASCQALVVEDSQERSSEKTDTAEGDAAGGKKEVYNDAKTVKNVSLFFLLDSVGLLLSSYLSGFLVSAFSLRSVFLTAAAVPALIALSGAVLGESIHVTRIIFIRAKRYRQAEG